MNKINIGNRIIGYDEPTFIIAEIGNNHNGSIKLAKKMILSAKKNGADCVKFQSWQPESIASKKEFDDNNFKEMGEYSVEYITLNSINDNQKFEPNSVKMLYSLPINSFTLVNDKENEIYLVKLVDSKKNTFDKKNENYLNFANKQNTNKKR